MYDLIAQWNIDDKGVMKKLEEYESKHHPQERVRRALATFLAMAEKGAHTKEEVKELAALVGFGIYEDNSIN